MIKTTKFSSNNDRISFPVHECLFCPQTFGSSAAKDDHILEHFAQEICTECDQKLLRIGNNLYTLHNAVTCVKFEPKLEANDSGSIESIASDAKQLADDFLECDEDLTELDDKIKNEAVSYDEEEQLSFDDCEDSIGSGDFSGTSAFVTHTGAMKDEPTEIDESNKQTTHSSTITSKSAARHTDTSTGTSVFHTKCGICNELFANLIELDKHMKIAHDINRFQCDICLKKVKSKNGLHIHKRYAHDNETHIWKFKCDVCKTPFMQKSSLQQHQCGEKPKCELCGKKDFSTIFALKSHIAFKHRNGPETINHVCKLCTRSFETAEERDEHRTICSYKRNIRASKISGELWCDLCLIKFDNNSLLRKHIQSMHDDCEKYECNSCCAIFMKASTYHNHFCRNPLKNRHNKEDSRISCKTCGKMLCNRAALQKHNTFFHSKAGTLFCSLCAQTFKNQADHNDHRIDCVLKRKMQKMKRYECNLCDFIAKSQISLRDHITKTHKNSNT